jgi:DNA modification methylase/predicted RNA-binding Zn-ribbon protein involved in translation (DUF1610 family)
LKEYKLSKRLLDKMRDIEGFPLGKDEDIITLSDPPYYTACPNPWIEDFIDEHGTPYDEDNDDYHREPFASDVSEGKKDPIYNAHSYPTKVPYKAVMRYILHYTEPGDIVFDGFCGSGMTGVAAQMCANKGVVESLGYRVLEDDTIVDPSRGNIKVSKLGARKAILNDLCPSATFIAYNYNTTVDVNAFEKEAQRILNEVGEECGWMYETNHTVNGKQQYTQDVNGNKKPVKGKINYTVWSDVFVCPSCTDEIVFWDAAVDKEKGRVKKEFNCPHCGASVTKRTLERAWETIYDDSIEETIKRAKQVPVLINYTVKERASIKKHEKRYEKVPDEDDLGLIKKIEERRIPYWYPTDKIPQGDKTSEPIRLGITNVHHFYTLRNLWVLATLWDHVHPNIWWQHVFTGALQGLSKLQRFKPKTTFPNMILTGTLYVGSMMREWNAIQWFGGKIKGLMRSMPKRTNLHKSLISITTQSATNFPHLSNECIDYIFTDPPFGGNLMYSELNFLWEAWLKVFTNRKQEAVINKTQKKNFAGYQHIMENCFKEYYRILKPGRWMTVEFHNSKNSVWMAIQEALMRAGFVVADVRTLDKKQGSFNQVSATGSAVKQDLIITAYKPNDGLEKRFKLTAGTEEGVWDFVRLHLKRLPVFVEKDGHLEVIAERQNFLLFDRMVAFHVQRGIIVPISAGDFYAGLRQRFPERDGMYFLPEQAAEYDKKRLTVKRVMQLSLTVHDEKSAVQWLRQELAENPQKFQDIQPKFLRKLHKDKHEKLPELLEVLEQNFLKDDDGRWYVPDPNKLSDLEKLKEKALLKEFEEYRAGKGRLKIFRTEAVRAGFKHAWGEKDYETIISIGKRLPENILQEDSHLLMYYDNAVMRAGER